ncbi:MAG: protein kinase domain-containing protein, partial [Planctomycetota bacterium]
TLLHYRIVDKLGEGGMGVVWRAVDTSLDREVAIKVLPAEMASQPDRLARFEREAKLLASLSHPNIAGIHGIHEVDGTPFLAMELVEGQDLQQRLAGGALPLRQTLEVALQIAHAFEAAHESGVIHRDLKPANVKLTDDHKVKVLDFGLAKALADPTQAGASPSMSPTLTSAGTMAGMVLGTAAYMSPEQAKAKDVDRRADIWSFGVVLFEMLSGRRLFQGEGISETLAAVIMKEVEWGSLPADTPPRIRQLLERCLERDPRLRLRDIGDARIAIEEVLEAPQGAAVVEATTKRRPAWVSIAPWVVTAAALAALGWNWSSARKPRAPAAVMRFTVALAEDQTLDNAPQPTLAISPDGRRIAYVGVHNGNDVIFHRLTRELESIPLPGTEDADTPFFSPDGEWIGFRSRGKLKKVSVLGGPPATLCDAGSMRGAAWGTDGTIVFAPLREGGLMRVSDAGGDPEPLMPLDDAADATGSRTQRWPQYLPGNRAVIFTSKEGNTRWSDAEIAAYSFEDKTTKTLVKEATFGRFVPPGLLVYARENTLFAARFDPQRLEVVGPAVPVLEGVHGTANFGSKQMDFSSSGTLIYLPSGSDQANQLLTWIDREGEEQPASLHERNYGRFDISPAGTHVAVGITSPSDDQEDIWILELERDTLTRLTFHEGNDSTPIWSPDGEWVTFASDRDGSVSNLYRKRADGTGAVERLTTSETLQWPNSWSPDGRALAFGERGTGSAGNLMLYRPGADPEIEPFLVTSFWEWAPQFSADGRFLVYSSAESGSAEVYVRPSDGTGAQVKISTSGGRDAQWAGTEELLYRSNDEILSASLSAGGDVLKPALPQPLLDLPLSRWSLRFRVSPDGRWILATKNVGPTSSRRDPVVVINWFDELEEKVPAAR